MKKSIIVFLMLLIIVSIVGCKSETVTEDIYKDQEEVIEEVIEPAEEELSPEPSPEVEEVEVVEEVIEEVIETPVEDVYESASEPIDFDLTELEGIEPTEVVDEAITAEIFDYLEPFYFNYFFELGVNEETGNVESDAMTLFALSYIVQHEYNELRFEPSTFTLYIPKEHVIDVVHKYFYRHLDVFNDYEDLKIVFKDDIYEVFVPIDEWDVDFRIASVEQLGDFTYKVLGEAVSKNSERVKEEVDVIIDKSHDGYVIINYVTNEVEE